MAWLCLGCQREREPDLNAKVCPHCGFRGVPADTADRVVVSITWHELRVLVIWAERWASSMARGSEGRAMRRALYGIADRLTAQHLDKPGLTLASELAELRSRLGRVEQRLIPEDDAAGFRSSCQAMLDRMGGTAPTATGPPRKPSGREKEKR